MKPSLIHLNFIFSILFLVSVEAVTEESLKVGSALKGKTYFAPRKSISPSRSSALLAAAAVPKKSVRIGRPLRYIESSESSESSVSEAASFSESDVASYSASNVASYSESDVASYSESSSASHPEFVDSSSSVSSTACSDDSISSCSSSSSVSDNPISRISRCPRSPLYRIDYQRPWCPGQVMASLATRALDPIYDWRNPLTCAQFASNFGGVSVIVGELDGPTLCFAGTAEVTSSYTIIRSLSINRPIYARALYNDVEYAVAAGPILYPQGLVLYISVAKEVSKLPQVCN